ncbi:hypothetical protein Esti_000884 [Eimeria stiedai]
MIPRSSVPSNSPHPSSPQQHEQQQQQQDAPFLPTAPGQHRLSRAFGGALQTPEGPPQSLEGAPVPLFLRRPLSRDKQVVAGIPGVDMGIVLKDASQLSQLRLDYPISIVAALTPQRGIGLNNALPWPHISRDFRLFSFLTKFIKRGTGESDKQDRRNAVVMGRKTWESLPPKAKPLKERINVIISSSNSKELEAVKSLGVLVASSLPAALRLLESTFPDGVENVFIIGGALVQASALALGLVSFIYLTRIAVSFECDTFFPSFGKVQQTSSSSSGNGNGSSGSCTAGDTTPQPPASGAAEPQSAAAGAGAAETAESGLRMRGDSGLWGMETDGFSTVFISRSKSHQGIPFDFAVLQHNSLLQQEQQQQQQQVSSTTAALVSLFFFSSGGGCPLVAVAAAFLQVLLLLLLSPKVSAILPLEMFELSEKRKSEKEHFLRVLPLLASRDHQEVQYLDLIADVISHGVDQPDRTGVGIRSVFGRTMRFSLKESFPLLTTKRDSRLVRRVVEELLWFIRGDTNANNLSKLGVKASSFRIWDLNATREFLDSRGLTEREQGDIGQGIDQLKDVIQKLRTNPHDRRILMTAWNPSALHLMALPPCHLLCQFYVSDGFLSCLMFQRSCDVGLGVPFNIASYSLLTLMIARICGLQPGEFVHFLGNTHVYNSHIEALKLQIQREPRPFPIVQIKGDPKEIEDFTVDSFELIGYNPHPTIKMRMAV